MTASNNARSWRVLLTSDTENLAELRGLVSGAAGTIGFDKEAIAQIELAIDEAIGNVIKHGYNSQAGQPIEITMKEIRHHDRPALEVNISDCGRQVNPQTIVGRDLDEIRPGGLGTHIIRNVMDEVEYSVREPLGMSLRMVKVLGADPTGS